MSSPTKFEAKKQDLSDFLSSFGPGVEDIRLSVDRQPALNGVLTGGVATSTHFLTKRMDVVSFENGDIVIADLAKVLAFLRACSDETVHLRQVVSDNDVGNLSIICGKSTISLPGTQTVRSRESYDVALRLVESCQESDYKEFGDAPLTCYGVIDISELSPISALGKVVGNDKPYHFSFVADNREGVIHTGTSTTGQMFHKFEIYNAVDESDEKVSKTKFGPWFSDVISCIPHGKSEVWTGADNVLIFDHSDEDFILVVIDQAAGDE